MVSKLPHDDLLHNPIRSDREPTPEQRNAALKKLTKQSEDGEDQKIDRTYSQLMYWSWVNQILNDPQGYLKDIQGNKERIEKINDALRSYGLDDSEVNQEEAIRERSGSSSYSERFDYSLPRGSGTRRSLSDLQGSVGAIPTIAVGERQGRIKAVLGDAAEAAGVSTHLMRGVWYKETGFSSIREMSSTGCAGPFQFSRGTWAEMVLKNGDEVAAHLAQKGFQAEASLIAEEHMRLRNKDYSRAQIMSPDSQLQRLRFNPEISAYMSAYYLKNVSNQLGVDAQAKENAGVIYAGYNVGVGSVRKMLRNPNDNAMQLLGNVAEVNPHFFRGGVSSAEALNRYDVAMIRGNLAYDKNIGSRDIHYASANTKQGPVIGFGDSHIKAMTGGTYTQNGQNLAGLRSTILSNIDTLPRGATIVSSVGSNDVMAMGKKSPETYAREYIKLLTELKDRGNNIVVVGIPELERSYNGNSPAEWNPRAERLNNAIRAEAARNGMSYVDMEGTSTDGLHRTKEGYKTTLQNAVYTTTKKPADLENDNPVRVASSTVNPARDVSVGKARPAEELDFVDRAKKTLQRFASLDLNPFS